MGLLLLFCAVNLSACGHIDFRALGGPVAHPETPGPEATQKDVALLLARLEAALNTCNAQFPAGQ